MPVIWSLYLFAVAAPILLGAGLALISAGAVSTWWKLIGIVVAYELTALFLSLGGLSISVWEGVILSLSFIVLPWAVAAWYIWVMFRFFRYPARHRGITSVMTPFFYMFSIFAFGGAGMYFLGYAK